RSLRQCGHAARGLRDEERGVCLRLAARGGRSLPASGQGAGPKEARGAPVPDPAHSPGTGDAGARVPPGLSHWGRPARRRHPRQRAPRLLSFALRGPEAQEALAPAVFLPDDAAAHHADLVTRDVAGGVGGKEDAGVGDLLRPAEAAERYLLEL